MKYKAIIFISFSLLSKQSLANLYHDDFNMMKFIDNSFYGVNFSYTNTKINFPLGLVKSNINNVELYYKYLLHPNLGIELGWINSIAIFKPIKINNFNQIDNLVISGGNLKLQFRYPFSEDFSIYSNIGVNKYNINYHFDISQYNQNALGFETSIGMENRFDSGIGLNIDYKYINSYYIESHQLLLGISYKFNNNF